MVRRGCSEILCELPLPSDASKLRVCAKTGAGQQANFEQNDPHPDPSDGRGNSQPRLSQLPKRLDTPTDGGRFSLSHPTQAAPEASPRRVGEGRAFAAPKRLRPRRRGEGQFSANSEVAFARVFSFTEQRWWT